MPDEDRFISISFKSPLPGCSVWSLSTKRLSSCDKCCTCFLKKDKAVRHGFTLHCFEESLKIHKVGIRDKASFVPQVIVKFLVSFLMWKYQSHLISSRLNHKQEKLCYYLCFLPGTQLMDSPVDILRQNDLSFHSEQIPPLLQPVHPLYGTLGLVSCKTQRIASDQPRQVICSTLMKDASLQ